MNEETQKKSGENEVDLHSESLLTKLYDIFSNLSLFVKVGAVMGLCSIIIAIIFAVLFIQLKKIEKIIFQQCKEQLLAVIYMQDRLLEGKTDVERQMALQEVSKILNLMVTGGVLTIEKDGVKFGLHFEPTWDCEKQRLLEDLMNQVKQIEENPTEEDIKSILQKLKRIAYVLMQNEFHNRNLIEKFLVNTRNIEFILLAVLGGVLLCGGIAFFLMVLMPLKKTTARIHDIAYTSNVGMISQKSLTAPFRDEIGRLVEEVNELIKYFDELGRFKRLLEEDDSLNDVYERLGRLLKERFGFSHFAIYFVSSSQNTMKVVYRSPQELSVNQEILVMADLCRAKRTGKKVSSLETKGICKNFIYENAEHVCIPLICGGKVGGIIQIIIPQENKELSQKVIDYMPQLNAFLEETLPVIEAKRYAESLKELAIKDQLTGLYNRRFVEQALDNITAGVLRRGTVLGVLMGDIDFFKGVNDEYGHDVGDEILAGIAKVLKENVRKADIVARFGGEEFLILLVDIREGEAVQVAEKLRKKVAEHPFDTKAGVLKKTISIGVSEFPVDSKGIWQVIKFADVALYKAKETGRNRVVRFQPKMWKKEQQTEEEVSSQKGGSNEKGTG